MGDYDHYEMFFTQEFKHLLVRKMCSGKCTGVTQYDLKAFDFIKFHSCAMNEDSMMYLVLPNREEIELRVTDAMQKSIKAALLGERGVVYNYYLTMDDVYILTHLKPAIIFKNNQEKVTEVTFQNGDKLQIKSFQG